jgi:polyisoprenoid-binding protein YceI
VATTTVARFERLDMRLPTTHALAAVLVFLPGQMREPLISQPQSRLWVEGTSTIRGFECKVTDFALTVNADGGGATKAVLAAQKVVRTVELTVPAEKIDCGNGTMNDHMREALKLDDAPTIRFTLGAYEMARTTDGVEGTMHGTLALGGAQHPIDVAAVATDAGDGALRVAGTYELSMSGFDLKPPSLMFGRIKVGDKVRVRFDLVLKS